MGRKNLGSRGAPSALALFSLIICTTAALADKPATKITAPTTTLRLLGARCLTNCWFSSLFAPGVVRDAVTAIPVTNDTPDSKITLAAEFVPTNGLAMTLPAADLALDDRNGNKLVGAGTAKQIEVDSGSTVQLRFALASTRIPAGLYTGQLLFKASGPNTGQVVQATAVEIRIRDSALWPLLTVVFGILLGRLAQFVYDPNVTAKVQLLDWFYELENKVEGQVPAANRAAFETRLADLKLQLFSRGIDPASLQPAFLTLQNDINQAINPPPPAPAGGPAPQVAPAAANHAPAGGFIGRALRFLAGVTPLPVSSVYQTLLPIFVLVTLVALTVVFMLQQYGGSGTAETFGAGGLADYAALFLAGVASESIAGGLRTVKLR